MFKKFLTLALMGSGGLILAVLGLIGLSLLMCFPTKWCWNYTMPYLFGLKTITWGQAWCLHFLAGVLIKSSQTNKGK